MIRKGDLQKFEKKNFEKKIFFCHVFFPKFAIKSPKIVQYKQWYRFQIGKTMRFLENINYFVFEEVLL